MSTVGAFVYSAHTLILTKMPDGASSGKIGYARLSLSNGYVASVTGAFHADFNLATYGSGSTNFITSPSATKPAAIFVADDPLFADMALNSLTTPVFGLLTYPALNKMVIAIILLVVYYLYNHVR